MPTVGEATDCCLSGERGQLLGGRRGDKLISLSHDQLHRNGQSAELLRLIDPVNLVKDCIHVCGIDAIC